MNKKTVTFFELFEDYFKKLRGKMVGNDANKDTE